MKSLQQFYKSAQWENFRRAIINERTNENGDVICAHCGRPIVRAYDMILHHTVELTKDNVNDYAVSLNPDLIELVHHKCHNTIHNKLGYAVRQIYLVYGPPLSGKSTWVSENMEPGDLVIDMDNLWQSVSGCDRYVKPGRLNAVVFGMRDYLIDCVRVRRGKWNNAYIIGGYPLCSERERICRELGAREIFIECSRDECMRRLSVCEDGRNSDEWMKYIDEWFRRYIPPTSTF